MTESRKLKPSEKEEIIKFVKELIKKEEKRRSDVHKKSR